jgi:CheY-like chemotaxis protein
MDGFEASKAIRDRGSTIPIVAMASGSDRERARDAGMDDCIAKPFRPELLAAVLKRWCLEPETNREPV